MQPEGVHPDKYKDSLAWGFKTLHYRDEMAGLNVDPNLGTGRERTTEQMWSCKDKFGSGVLREAYDHDVTEWFPFEKKQLQLETPIAGSQNPRCTDIKDSKLHKDGLKRTAWRQSIWELEWPDQ